MNLFITAQQVKGLPLTEQAKLNELINIYTSHAEKNGVKERYYEGKISLSEVNLGIAIPKTMRELQIGCAWGAKAVDVLAGRSMFDGFVNASGVQSDELTDLVINNDLIAEYAKACRDELKFGCTYATLSADDAIGCKVRFHSPLTAAAHWNGDLGRIDYGFAVINIDMMHDRTQRPTMINLYTDDAIWVLRYVNNLWTA